MKRNIELLLVESVDNLGIVGDVVKVRTGYARNYLLPRGFATEPDQALIAQLAEKRKQAEAERAQQRKRREEMVEQLAGHEMKLERSCNDMGVLYAAVTQVDIAGALEEGGFHVRARDVRLPGGIKRLGSYDVQVKFEADLETSIKLVVEADRHIDEEERSEMEFDEEGNLIDPDSEEGKRIREAEKNAPRGAGMAKSKIEDKSEDKKIGW